MASGLTGNEVPGNRLWVRVPCPPLESCQAKLSGRLAGLCVRLRSRGMAGCRKDLLSGWPLQRPASEQVEMQVVDRLPPLLSTIDHDTIALVQFQFPGQIPDHYPEMA